MTRAYAWLAGLGAALLALLGMMARERGKGRAQERQRRDTADADAATDMHRRITNAEADRPRDADDARQRLRDRASRRPPA